MHEWAFKSGSLLKVSISFAHVSLRMSEHMMGWSGGLEMRCVPVSESIPAFVFQALLTHFTMSWIFFSFFFALRSLSYCLCSLRKMWSINCPCEWRGKERNKANGSVSLRSRLPFDLCLLNITSTEVRDHQEAKTMARKTQLFTFNVCSEHRIANH